MFGWFKNLQRKPEGYRKKFAFFVSATFTLVVAIFWMTSVFSSSDPNPGLSRELGVADVSGPIDSLGSMFESFGRSVNGVVENFSW